jgi:hypothetical protein
MDLKGRSRGFAVTATAMAGALVAALRVPLLAALFTLVLVQKETAPMIAVAVVAATC